uniref:Uncharacterized protein n=1 Tax=Glossina brevipalpis TaxID=37001 RepID=A0A1A9WFF5_9MUSC
MEEKSHKPRDYKLLDILFNWLKPRVCVDEKNTKVQIEIDNNSNLNSKDRMSTQLQQPGMSHVVHEFIYIQWKSERDKYLRAILNLKHAHPRIYSTVEFRQFITLLLTMWWLYMKISLITVRQVAFMQELRLKFLFVLN